MDPPATSPGTSAIEHPYACIRCSERKVKCNKQEPCISCARHDVKCIFRPTKPSRKKRKYVRDEMLDERLRQCEALLREKGVDPDQVFASPGAEQHRESSNSEGPESTLQMPTPDSTASGPRTAVFKPHLVHGQRGTKLVDNSLWSRVAEEMHDADEASEEDSMNDASDEEATNTDFAYVLGGKTRTSATSHPPAEIIRQFWYTFLENVNPLSKIVHVPSLQPAIEKAIADIAHVPKGFEALMFAIYSMAVLSLTENECKKMTGEARSILLPRYVASTKMALSRAKFMSSTSIVVLQALFLHILSIRDTCEARAVWTLTGAAIRIAEGMGMRLDGTLLGLSPFETEIRRRIWWQLRMHDFRAAELSGQAKFRFIDIDDTSPKAPTNNNDSDLYPTMSEAPIESTKPTEMIFCLFRTELAGFAASQKLRMRKEGMGEMSAEEFFTMDASKTKLGFIDSLIDLIERKYLRFCDPSQPLQLLTLVVARAGTNIMTFIGHHPRRWVNMDQVPASEQQLVWDTVIQLLQQYNMMQSNQQLRRFAWSVPYFIQWQAVIHVLDTVRADPFHVDAMKAWQLIDDLYEFNSDMLLGTNKPIFVAVGNLCLKAYNARTVALAKENMPLSKPPDYINKLREQREAAKTRKEAVIAKDRGKETLDGVQVLTTNDVDTTWSGIDVRPTLAQHGKTQARFQPMGIQPATEDDAFWLTDALDNGNAAGGAADPMHQDTDNTLTQESWFDTPDGQVIDWAQWDAWLGNVEPMRPMRTE